MSFFSKTSSSSITSSSPLRISLATHPFIWLDKSSLLKAFTAALMAADCISISVQYASFSIIPLMPLICPSILLSLCISFFCSSEVLSVVLQQHVFFSLFSILIHLKLKKIPLWGILIIFLLFKNVNSFILSFYISARACSRLRNSYSICD